MINKTRWSGVLLGALLLVSGCTNQDTATGSAGSSPPPPGEPDAVSYIQEANPESREETILIAALYANLLIADWGTLEDIHPDCFFQFYEAMAVLGEIEQVEGAYVPADIVEEVVAAHFGAEAVPLARTSFYYEFEGGENAYWVGGLGNVVELTLDSVSQEGICSVLSYSRYFNGEWQHSGELLVEMEEDGGFRYRSHHILSE